MSSRHPPIARLLSAWLLTLVGVLTQVLPACDGGQPLGPLLPIEGDWIDPSLAPDWQPPAAGHGLDEALEATAARDEEHASTADPGAADGLDERVPTTDLAEAPSPDHVARASGAEPGSPVDLENSGLAADAAQASDVALAADASSADETRPVPADGQLLELDFEELALPEGTLAAVAADGTAAVSLPDEITALDGRLVALAGFLIPTVEGGTRMRRFALSYDPPGCCFGEAGSLDKWVVVELEDDADPVEYRFWGVARVEGRLSVGARRGEYGHLESLYRLRGRRAELIE